MFSEIERFLCIYEIRYTANTLCGHELRLGIADLLSMLANKRTQHFLIINLLLYIFGVFLCENTVISKIDNFLKLQLGNFIYKMEK